MNEGEVRIVVKAYDHEGKFIDDFSFIADDRHAIYENETDVFDFMESVVEQNRSLYENLCSVSNPETITRRRRELYNLGLITYTDEAEERREEAFNNERERAAPKAVSWLKDD